MKNIAVYILFYTVVLGFPLLAIFCIVKKWRVAAIALYFFTTLALFIPQRGAPYAKTRLRVYIMQRVSAPYHSLVAHLANLSANGHTQESAQPTAHTGMRRSEEMV